MNKALMFSSGSQAWTTPRDLFVALDKEFKFTLDAAAEAHNAQCARWLGPGSKLVEDALMYAPTDERIFCNPPYARTREFIAWAAQHQQQNTIVCLVASRTDTRWWHESIWDTEFHRTRPGVSVRFLKGRLKFGAGRETAPFPSVVIIFWRQG